MLQITVWWQKIVIHKSRFSATNFWVLGHWYFTTKRLNRTDDTLRQTFFTFPEWWFLPYFGITVVILFFRTLCIAIICHQTSGFWDIGSTTTRLPRTDDTPRQSFFRWQWITFPQWWFWNYDWTEIHRRRRLNVMAGISIDLLCINTAVILNRRVLISSYNAYDRYMQRQLDMRIWALGRAGAHNTPFRYRVYRITRVFPLSSNPEHCHGPNCIHQPRHDIAIIFSLDQMYLYNYYPTRYHYAYRAYLCEKRTTLGYDIWFSGSGYEYMEHILENYKIFFAMLRREDIVDCSLYLPKWWGKFICIINRQGFPGLQNGGGLFNGHTLVGIGCFEIRINDDKIFVFTDLRYYFDHVHHYAYLYPGQYYEYAYPQWGVKNGWFIDGSGNYPYMPHWQIKDDIYPMGK